jgi:hypothetical protein
VEEMHCARLSSIPQCVTALLVYKEILKFHVLRSNAPPIRTVPAIKSVITHLELPMEEKSVFHCVQKAPVLLVQFVQLKITRKDAHAILHSQEMDLFSVLSVRKPLRYIKSIDCCVTLAASFTYLLLFSFSYCN